MPSKTLPNYEEQIYKKLDFTNEICRIRLKYNDDGLEHPYFKLKYVKLLMKAIDYPYEYSGENSHGLTLKKYKDLDFIFGATVKQNIVLPVLVILKNGKYFGPKFTNLYWLLNVLPYDESLLNPNFKINTLDDLKNYILDLIELCNKFSDEYIKEIEAGNVPDIEQ